MAIKSKDIYKGRKKSKSRPWIITGVILALLGLLIGSFYAIRGLCVYDETGNATIIWPWETRPETTPTPSEPLPTETGGLIPGDGSLPSEGSLVPSEDSPAPEDGSAQAGDTAAQAGESDPKDAVVPAAGGGAQAGGSPSPAMAQ